jgi:NTP pyrophosphatase (non-canonical NTP hydrolase)
MGSKSQEQLIELLKKSDSLTNIQSYLKEVLEIRKLNNQKPEQKMLILTEEVGELAKAIRKSRTDMPVDLERLDHYNAIREEIADVLIVLLSLCNELEIDCYSALMDKERQNIERIWKKEN